MKRFLLSFLRLRWKLTLSYALVTVGALVVVGTVLFVGLGALVGSGVLPGLMARGLSDLAAEIKPHMAQSPPDIEGIEREMDVALVEDDSPDNRRPGPEIVGYGGSLFLLDSERRLVGGIPPVSRSSAGERFEAGGMGELRRLVGAASEGVSDPGRLHGRTPEGELVAVAPVEGDDGRVAGVVVGVVGLPTLAGPLFTGLALSAVALTAAAGVVSAIFGFLTAWRFSRRLRRLTTASRAWSEGDFSFKARDRSHDELGELARDLNLMSGELESLVQTRQELASLEARNRFARDLHDSVKQQVFATSLELAAARTTLTRDPQNSGRHLEQAAELVQQAQKELNNLIHQMRPATLEDRGLPAALREYAESWSRGTGIQAGVTVQGEGETPFEIQQALFRVAQEALANVARHSGAETAELDLYYSPDSITLTITDDGHGFDPEEKRESGFGLDNMHQQMEKLGGHVKVASQPGGGTQVVCSCPLEGVTEARKDGEK